MNIVKFKDIVMTEKVLEACGYAQLLNEEWVWTEESPFKEITVDAFCAWFNTRLRNQYVYAIRWSYIAPLDLEGFSIGNPFENPGHDTYVGCERDVDESEKPSYVKFENLKSWMDEVTTLIIMQNEAVKYKYLNEFTPDDDITIEELKVFRTWLASILLANKPVIDSWKEPDMLTAMLTYYKQNMQDTTTDILSKFSGYMLENVLVAGSSKSQVNLAALGLTSGCGCMGGVQGVGNVGSTMVCDPLQMYKNSIYNYMVEVFSTIEYWQEQVEICIEMRKYIEGILKVGLPLGSRIIDPLADCGCNTLDGDAQVRYTNMLKALIQALTYIIDGNVAGNRNYIATAFSNWATYLYEYMYWA